MKMFMFAFAVVASAVAFAGEEQSVLVTKPAPVAVPVVESAPVEIVSNCSNGRCCVGGKCFIREPRFERNVSTTTTCDACGVKEKSRTVTRTRRFR